MQLPINSSELSELWQKLPQQRIALAIVAVLVIYLAYLFAQMTWLLAGNQSSQFVPTSPTSSVKGNQPVDINVNAIKQLHLFGRFDESKVVETVQVQDAPETSLRLTLSGTVASDNPKIAAAIIEHNGKQETYGIGDKITGTRATLEQVTFDRVIIKHSGKLETLMLDGFEYSKNARGVPVKANTQSRSSNRNPRKEKAAQKEPTVVDHRDNQALSQSATELKNVLSDDPAKIIDYLKITPHREGGSIVGYRLMPGKNPEFFAQSGLKSGDVAIQINGLDLTVPSDAAQAIQSLKDAQEVSLLVDRNGEINEILFSITSEL